MKTLRLTIRCEGSAFEEVPGSELARILHNIACNLQEMGIEGYDHYQTVIDANGNDVGRWKVG